MRGGYRDAIDKIMSYDAPIVGEIAPQWVMYIDRIIEDFPNTKFIWLSRRNQQEVAKSFYSYLQHSNKRELFLDDAHGWYPVQEEEFSLQAIYRTVKRYEWLCRTAEQFWADGKRMFRVYMDDLNDEASQKAILKWIGAEEPWDLHMPHVNKRDWKIKQALKHSNAD